MRLYFATIDADDIRWGLRTRLLDGVVATPSVIAAALPHADPREVVTELIGEGPPLQYFVSVGSLDPDVIVREAKELRRLSEGVIIAIPFVEDTLSAFGTLAAAGVPLAATLIHSVAQGLLAAKAGATKVVLAVDALEAIGVRAEDVVRDLHGVFHREAVECDVVVAGPPNAARLGELAAAGADAAVVTTEAVRSFLQHPLTDRGIDRFLVDVSRRARPRRAK